MPVEFGGISFDAVGELAIRRGQENGTLEVQAMDELGDRIRPPVCPPGTPNPTYFGAVDGEILATHIVRITGAPTTVSAGGMDLRRYPCQNESTVANINIYSGENQGVGSRFVALSTSPMTHVEGGITYRGIGAQRL